MNKESKQQIIARADKRMNDIAYDISQLENETALLKRISQAAYLNFDEELPVLMNEYRQLYKKNG